MSWCALALGLGGCVRVYQPMSAYRPVVVDSQAANLADLRLTVRCLPGDLLTQGEAQAICRKVGKLFEVQGAVVQAPTAGGLTDEPPAPDGPPRTDLTVEVRGRRVHEGRHPLSWVTSIATGTLLPGVHEITFAHDVRVWDAEGFLLASDAIQGRLITRFGLGSWVGTRLTDLGIREREDRLIGSVTRDLSGHVYGRLSQVVFNAKLQWEVQREAVGEGSW